MKVDFCAAMIGDLAFEFLEQFGTLEERNLAMMAMVSAIQSQYVWGAVPRTNEEIQAKHIENKDILAVAMGGSPDDSFESKVARLSSVLSGGNLSVVK